MKSIWFLALLTPLFCIGQEAIPAVGGDASGSGGSVSFTVGQVAYSENTGSSASEWQGVQQSYVLSITAIGEAAGDIRIEVEAFPNPTHDILKLMTSVIEGRSLEYHLYDMQGKLLQNESINQANITIGVGHLSSSAYILKVMEHQLELKVFKILKK